MEASEDNEVSMGVSAFLFSVCLDDDFTARQNQSTADAVNAS